MALDYSREHPISFYGSCEVKERQEESYFFDIFYYVLSRYVGVDNWTWRDKM